MKTTATTQHAFFRSLFSSRMTTTLCLSLGLMVCLIGLAPTPVQAQNTNTYVVNSTGDAGDANLGDGVCDDGNGNCTLRAAIEEANQSTDQDVIEFGDIAPGAGPAQITPGSELTVSETVTIDGSTENSYSDDAPTVLIDGNSLPSNTDGLYLELSANGSTIEALAVVDAPSDGIDVGSEVTIQDCYIGVSTDGTTANGNGNAGIRLFGDDNFAFDNVIGGNANSGVLVQGNTNYIYNNRIGVGADGTTDVGNGAAGVRVDNANNFIGACIFGGCAGNIISGNDGAGIQINANGQTVVTNYIGTDESGTSSLPNNNGIAVESDNNTIGGTDDQRNVISGNQFNGIRIGVGNQTPADNNTVDNNYIGTDAAGTSAVPNGNGGVEGGIRFDEGTGNEILENVIAGNNAHGIRMRGSGNNTIRGNRVGVDPNGNPLGNTFDGILVQTGGNSIGGLDSGEENIIGDNALDGIHIEGDNNLLTGNYIGTNPSDESIGNGEYGVEMTNGASGNELAHTYGDNIFTSRMNTIAYNGNHGVAITGSNSLENAVRANRIYGNSGQGIYLGSGYDGNDNGDTDEGPNRGQNHPAVVSVENCDDSSSPTTVDVTYEVRSNDDPANASNYGSNGLKIDFYVADNETSGEGKTHIGTANYNSPLSPSGTTLSTSAATCDDFFVATATDAGGNTPAGGNTSEFFAPSRQLPVELTTFDARTDGETVQLSWKTASETNNAGFNVQRKRSGDDGWTKVGFVEGHGTTSEPQTYAFDDAGVPFEADSLRYRLKQVDLDGAFEYSESVEVAIAGSDELVLHGNFPNPFQGQTTIRYALPQSGPVQLAIYNALGQRVATLLNSEQDAGRQQIRFDARGLSSGVYFLRLTSNGTTRTQKLTVVQ